MNRNKLISLFWKRFISTLLVLLVVGLAGYMSYKTTISYYKGTGRYDPVKANNESKLIQAKAEEVSKNLIFSVNEKTGRINHLLLEVFHTESLTITYVQIPVSTQYNMSSELYQNVSEANPNAPQTVTISNMLKYFDESNAMEYSVLIMNEMLGIEASYYTVLEKSDFESIYENGKIKSSYKKQMSGLVSEEAYTELIIKYYEKIQTNLILKKKLIYVPYYLKMNHNNIAYERVAGSKVGNYYTIDIEKAHTQIQKIIYFVKK